MEVPSTKHRITVDRVALSNLLMPVLCMSRSSIASIILLERLKDVIDDSHKKKNSEGYCDDSVYRSYMATSIECHADNRGIRR
jgi:hypothetical protein